MKKIKARRKVFRINSPISFGILCAVIIALIGGGAYALTAGVVVPAVDNLTVNALPVTPEPLPTETPAVVTPDPAVIQQAIADGTFVTMDPNTGAVIKDNPTPTPEPTPTPSPTPMPLEGRTIVIDPGKSKGADHRGVSSRTYEYKINLAFAQALEEQLTSMGAKVILTRTSNSKVVGASARVKTINNAKADIAVSLFCNDVSSSEVRGAEAYIAKNAKVYDSSLKLARSVLNGYTTATSMPVRESNGETVRTVTNKEVLTKAKIPVMGLVLGQLSNKADDANLNDAAFIKKAARGIANGIKNYFG